MTVKPPEVFQPLPRGRETCRRGLPMQPPCPFECPETWQATGQAPPLGPEEVHVWRFGLDLPAAREAELERFLAPDERARADRFWKPVLRRRFVVARGLLRTLLAGYLGGRPEAIPFSYGPQGKPALGVPAGLEFNLSHSQDRGLLAVARRPVGIDLETLRDGLDTERLAARCFAAEERHALELASPSERSRLFFTHWVRKEAFLKATGRGLADCLSKFAILHSPGEGVLRLQHPEAPEGADPWAVRDLHPGADTVAALAVAGQGWPLSCWEPPDAPWTSGPYCFVGG